MAYVWQSEAGAKAVIGSNIVRADLCSEVDGSNRMTFPWEFPTAFVSMPPDEVHGAFGTKCYIPILHPRCDSQRLI